MKSITMSSVKEKIVAEYDIVKIEYTHDGEREVVELTDSWKELLSLMLGMFHYYNYYEFLKKLFNKEIMESDFRVMKLDDIDEDTGKQYFKLGATGYYIVSSMRPWMIADKIKLIAKEIGLKPKDVTVWLVDTGRIKQEMNIKPRTSLKSKSKTKYEISKTLVELHQINVYEYVPLSLELLGSDRRINNWYEMVSNITMILERAVGSDAVHNVLQSVCGRLDALSLEIEEPTGFENNYVQIMGSTWMNKDIGIQDMIDFMELLLFGLNISPILCIMRLKRV